MAYKGFDLSGKVALVTGGNGGIGLGIARGLAQAGARVAIIARNSEKSHAAAKTLAEETGAVIPICEWVLNAAREQKKAWTDAGLPPFRVSLNLSPRQLDDRQLLGELLQRVGVPSFDET